MDLITAYQCLSCGDYYYSDSPASSISPICHKCSLDIYLSVKKQRSLKRELTRELTQTDLNDLLKAYEICSFKNLNDFSPLIRVEDIINIKDVEVVVTIKEAPVIKELESLERKIFKKGKDWPKNLQECKNIKSYFLTYKQYINDKNSHTFIEE